MAKGNTVKFLEGAIAGIALGIAGSMFMASKTGKEVAGDVRDMMADFYKKVSPKLKKIKKMGEAEYKIFMKSSAEQYGKAKKMSEEKIKQLVKEAQKSWAHISKHVGK